MDHTEHTPAATELEGPRVEDAAPPASEKAASASGAPKAERPRTPHPLAGATLRTWLHVLRDHGGVHRDRVRALRTSAWIVGGTGVRVYEKLRYARRIAGETLDPPPVFILGHWRSGTTNLHNLLLQDPQFGAISFLHCLIPSAFLTLRGFLRRLLERRIPEKRPMDEVRAGLDEPMSEDFAMANVTDLTHYHAYYFPTQADRIFRETVLFEGVPPETVDRWGRTYVDLLRKISYDVGGRQLVLKNPPNTARVRRLLKLFPDAKFIFMYRNPFAVYGSTCRLMERFLDFFAFQEFDMREVQEHVLERYQLLMQRYFDERDLIPPENLIEIRHEDLVADPVANIEQIYSKLDLPGFDRMRPRLEAYVESLSGYRVNKNEMDAETVDRIRRHWGFTIDRWGYAPPGGTGA